MKIEYYRKNVFGSDRLYVLAPGAAAIKRLTGKVTVDEGSYATVWPGEKYSRLRYAIISRRVTTG